MSEDSQKKFTFTWEIENFDFCMVSDNECLKSPIFVADISKTINWYLKISVINGEDYFSCYLSRTEDGADEIHIKYTIELRAEDGELLQSCSSSDVRTFSKIDACWGWDNFYEIDELKSKCFGEKSITFQCIIFPHELIENYSGCKGSTKIPVDRSCFRWNVKEINSPSWVASKIFLCSSEADFETFLTAPEDTVNISIKKVNKENYLFHYVDCKLSLLDLNEIEQDSKRSQHFYQSEEEEDIWEFPDFLQKSKLQDKINYLKNGTFTLMCEFSVSNGRSFGYIEDYHYDGLLSSHSDTDECTDIVLQDLKQMYTRRLHTDVYLRTKEQTFPAHKSVLSARSPVFAAMFEQDLLENKTRVVDIPDEETKFLDCFLMFLYSGTVDNMDYESASKLVMIAEKYQVPSLKKKCSSFLMSNLSVSNVCDVALISDMIGHEELKTLVVEFIAAHTDEILVSDDWTQCIRNNIRLATDILHKLSVNVGAKNAVSKTKF